MTITHFWSIIYLYVIKYFILRFGAIQFFRKESFWTNPEMTKIDIFSGFLGAGKTTLIKKLIKEAYAGEKLVLIENEFGEIGIDGGFLADAGIEITEMNSGCICCSLVGDFSKALGKVLEEYHPDRIIIEPSGVGKLSDVIKAASTVCGEEAELNTFTTVVDANKCKMYMKNFGEFFGDQIKHASCIVLSHTQTTKEHKLEEALHIIRENNADAVIVTTPWDSLNGKAILSAMEKKDTLAEDMEHLEHEHKHHHEHHEHCGCDHHHHEHNEHCECGHHHHEHDEHCECGHHHHEHDEHCKCGHHHHEHDEHCECGHHHHEHDEHCECGHHHHEHDEHCECGHHHHEHDEHCECGHHHHEHDEHCECGHHHHEHDEHCDCGHHHHEHDEHCECGHHHHEHHDEGCSCGCHDHDHHHHHADEVFQSFGRETTKKFGRQELYDILEGFSEDDSACGMILRAKGIVECKCGKWLHFDYIPGEIDIREGIAGIIGRLCVIGAGLDEDALTKIFGI